MFVARLRDILLQGREVIRRKNIVPPFGVGAAAAVVVVMFQLLLIDCND